MRDLMTSMKKESSTQCVNHKAFELNHYKKSLLTSQSVKLYGYLNATCKKYKKYKTMNEKFR